MIPHRRHRKASATPTRSIEDSPVATASPGRRGLLSSYFATARRRWGKTSREAIPDTLLPTTFSTKHTQHGLDRASINCNSFLMGGHYYPGKDKKRRHMRRKTLWYRLFCSSPWRRVACFIILLYVVFWHGLVPFGEWLVQVGGYLSPGVRKGATASWLQFDSTLEIPNLENEEFGRLQVASERARLQYGSPQRSKLRLEILEQIVPSWYHRNDGAREKELAAAEKGGIDSAKSDPDSKKQGSKKKTTKEKPKHEQAAKAPTDPKKKEEAESPGQQVKDPNKQRKVQLAKGDQFPERNLRTMDGIASKHTSSCPLLEPYDVETTLVIQTSISRLWILNETCSRWKDPIVVVVFVPFDIDPPELSFSCPHVKAILYMASRAESEVQAYPVNRLRNVGLESVATSHVLTLDIDFVPSHNLHEVIRATIQNQLEMHEDSRALVVPAFDRLTPEPCTTEAACESFLKNSKDFLPHSFSDLQSCVKAKECEPFQSSVSWESHSSTRSEEWIQRNWYTGEEPKLLRAVDCFHSARYEPYVVLRWCSTSSETNASPRAPYYDERFHGYGKNKIELISHLRKSGYRFSILPEGFVVHNPHPESAIKEEWNDREGSELHSSMDKLYGQFMHELEEKYKGVQGSSIKLCPRQPGK
eukprot:scaffold683_cov124-Cylindrotheca_fusiformis.AAC.18